MFEKHTKCLYVHTNHIEERERGTPKKILLIKGKQ
jgi:hypothetical protein